MFFISTGSQNVYYTLRSTTINEEAGIHCNDYYICNLSIDVDTAIEKAKAYVDAYRDRVGETSEFKVEFGGVWDAHVIARHKGLTAKESNDIETVWDGLFPFGKHRGEYIAKAPDSYVLFWADKNDTSPVVAALSSACLGVAIERGLIAKRDEERAAQKAQDMMSNFIGEVGQRITFEGEVVSVFEKEDRYSGDIFYINKIRVGDDLVTYIGKKLANKGDNVSFKATIKDHHEYEGVKSTKVNRPKMI